MIRRKLPTNHSSSSSASSPYSATVQYHCHPYLRTPSPELGPYSSPIVYDRPLSFALPLSDDGEADDGDTMSSMEGIRTSPSDGTVGTDDDSQPPSLIQPYNLQRPTLPEVLANSAPPPWTLSAFTAYLSQNHCLENLEFTLDAGRYRSKYNQIMQATADGSVPVDTDNLRHLRMLWKRLMQAYIIPDCVREINIPSQVRDSLLAMSTHFTAPAPSALDDAVQIVYNLMEESVLIAFLNEFPSPRQQVMRSGKDDRQRSVETSRRRRGTNDSSSTTADNRSIRSFSRRRTSPTFPRNDVSPPPMGEPSGGSSSSPSNILTTPYNPFSVTSSSDPTTRQPGSNTHRLITTNPTAPASGISVTSAIMTSNPPFPFSSALDVDCVTDEAPVSASSATASAIPIAASEPEPMTPPNTPPSSDFGESSPRSRTAGSDHGWKKMMLGWKKRGGPPSASD